MKDFVTASLQYLKATSFSFILNSKLGRFNNLAHQIQKVNNKEIVAGVRGISKE